MCGSAQTSTNTSSSTSLPAWATSAGQSGYTNASDWLSANPWSGYSGPTSAGFGTGTTTANDYGTSNLGTPNPNQAQATTDINSVVGGIQPNESISDLMNPYVAATLQPTLDSLAVADQQGIKSNAAASTLSGDFGGSTGAVTQGINQKNYEQNVADATNQAYSQAFNAAQGQQNTQNQEIETGGTNLSNVGSSENTQNDTLAALLASIGAQQQSAGQTGISNAITLNTQNQTEPLAQQQTLETIANLAPKDTSTTGNSTTTAPDNTGLALLGSLLSSA